MSWEVFADQYDEDADALHAALMLAAPGYPWYVLTTWDLMQRNMIAEAGPVMLVLIVGARIHGEAVQMKVSRDAVTQARIPIAPYIVRALIAAAADARDLRASVPALPGVWAQGGADA